MNPSFVLSSGTELQDRCYRMALCFKARRKHYLLLPPYPVILSVEILAYLLVRTFLFQHSFPLLEIQAQGLHLEKQNMEEVQNSLNFFTSPKALIHKMLFYSLLMGTQLFLGLISGLEF